ncbi:MAG: biotin/lipoyl-binding protein [Candidatus Methanofastidiosia archaeon]|jgi:biotin carboxyl carrier protein
MKYTIVINGESHEVEVKEKGTQYIVSIDGIDYEASITEMKKEEKGKEKIEKVHVPSQPVVSAPLVSKKETAPGSVTAPMPGTVLAVHVSEGDSIKIDDVLITLEAMKMENEISSPVSGTIKEVNVKEGQTVNTGDVLLVIQ